MEMTGTLGPTRSRALSPSTASRGENGLIRFGECFGDVVDLNRPAQVHLDIRGRLHDVGGLDQPFSAAGRDEETQHDGIEGDDDGEAPAAADAREEFRQLIRDGLAAAAFRLGEDRGHGGVQRKLDEDAACGRYGFGDGTGTCVASRAARAPI